MKFSTLLAAALYAVFAPATLNAQTPAAHTLQGVVHDTTGAVMAGVDVILLLPDGEPLIARTDEVGRFTFADLSVGTYRITAAAAGFGEVTESIAVDDPVEMINLVMQVVLTEHVEVASDLAASGSAGLTATMMTGAALDALPDDPGALLQRLRELAGATGGTGQVSITIDGFPNTEWTPPKQAIQAIRLSSNWFAPEFAAPGQARIEILTKPGSSEVHGDIRFNVNDETLNARNAMAADRPSGRMRDVTGFVSGPVIEGRWSFVAYGGEWTQQQNQVIAADVLDSTFVVGRHVQTVRAPSAVGNVWIGTTYQVAPQQTLALSYSRTWEHADNLGLTSGIDLPSRAYRRTSSNSALRTTVTSVPSSIVLNELRLQVNPAASTVEAASSAPAVMVLNTFNEGGNQDALFTDSERLSLDASNALTVYVPKHTLKAGFEMRTIGHRHTDRANFGGAFLFGTAPGRDETTGTPLADTYVAPLENYRRTLMGLPGYTPSQFWIAQGIPDVAFRENGAGGYVQDDWAATGRLTVSYGVRTDWQSAASRPAVAVRGGIGLALDAARRNVVRAGVGTFYQRIESELTRDVTRLDGHQQQQILIDNPSFFPAIPVDVPHAAMVRPTTYVADAKLRAPQVVISAVSHDLDVGHGMFVTTKYTHQHGSDLLRTIVMNPGASAGGLAGDPRVLRFESSGRLRRHELSAGWRWTMGRMGSVFANYSRLHGRGDTDGYRTTPSDTLALDLEYGPLAADRPHQGNAGANFTLPGAISLSPYLTAASGQAFNITTGLDINGDGLLVDRPESVAPGTPGAIRTQYGWLRARPAPGAPSIARNRGREPSMMRVDLRASRAFRYGMGAILVVASSAENLLNRANVENINGVITSASFGRPQRAAAPRRLTFSAGFSF